MGKSTLLGGLLPILISYGYRVSVIKQTHAEFDVDRPGKDSYLFREAGARQVLLSSPNRWALLAEDETGSDDSRLLGMVRHLDSGMADFILVEGFRNAPIPKIEVYRSSCGKPPIACKDENIILVATDAALSEPVASLDLNKPEEIAIFIRGWLSNWKEMNPYFHPRTHEEIFISDNLDSR